MSNDEHLRSPDAFDQLAHTVDKALNGDLSKPKAYAFALVVAPVEPGADGSSRFEFISNADRSAMVAALETALEGIDAVVKEQAAAPARGTVN